MKAVILAAGEGKRMRPLTYQVPKPMLLIHGKPILHHILNALPEEIDEICMVVGYLKDSIKNYFGTSFNGKSIHYINQEKKGGTFHALSLCKKFIGAERFMVLYADDIQKKEDLEKCILHRYAVLAHEVDQPERFGVIVKNSSGHLEKIVEKPSRPPSSLVSTGVLVLDSTIFGYPVEQHPNGEYYLTAALDQMAREHDVAVVPASFWIPIGYPEDLEKAEYVLRKK